MSSISSFFNLEIPFGLDVRTPKGNLEYCNYGITDTRKQKRCQLEASPDTTHDDEIAVPTPEENLNNLSVK